MALNLSAWQPLRTLPKVLEAAYYNRVRLALVRLGKPLILELPGFRGLEVILDDRSWVCIDLFNNGKPVVAWTDFDTKNRAAIHEPVSCKLHLYHHHAGLIMGTSLEALNELLVERLAASR